MNRPPRLAALMTPFPYFLEADQCAADAISMMAEHSVHHLPVMDGDRIVGVLTSRSLEGADAEAFLQRVCTNDMALDVGRVVYTLMLNGAGGIGERAAGGLQRLVKGTRR